MLYTHTYKQVCVYMYILKKSLKMESCYLVINIFILNSFQNMSQIISVRNMELTLNDYSYYIFF